MKKVKENYPEKTANKITELINEIKKQGYEVKVNCYKVGRKELRILSKKNS